jgi:hypothetical protein
MVRLARAIVGSAADIGPLEKLEASRIPRSREERTILWSLVR